MFDFIHIIHNNNDTQRYGTEEDNTDGRAHTTG